MRLADLPASLLQLLQSYGASIGISDYEQEQKRVDAVSARAFHMSSSASPASSSSSLSQLPAAAALPTAAEHHVFGVPSEYDGATDITGGSHTAVAKVPWYVTKANKDLEGSEYSRHDSPTPAVKASRPRSEDATEAEAKSPLMSAPKGLSVSQIIAKAVGNALASANEPEQDADAGRAQNLYQFSTSSAAPARAGRPAAVGLAAAGVGDEASQMQLTRSVEAHLDDEINAIYGSGETSEAPLRVRAHAVRAADVKAMAERFEKMKGAYGRTVPTAVERRTNVGRMGRRVDEMRRKQAVIEAVGRERKGTDGVVRGAEAKEISELRKEVEEMKEKQQLHALKLQVSGLKKKVEEREATADEKAQKWGRGERGYGKWGGLKGGVGLGIRMVEEGKREMVAGEEKVKEEKEREAEEGEREREKGEEVMRAAREEVERGEKKEREAIRQEEDEGKPKRQHIKVCDGMGCRMEAVSTNPPPQKKLSEKAYIKEGLTGGNGNLWDLLFPWDHSLDTEVHLNNKVCLRDSMGEGFGLGSIFATLDV